MAQIQIFGLQGRCWILIRKLTFSLYDWIRDLPIMTYIKPSIQNDSALVRRAVSSRCVWWTISVTSDVTTIANTYDLHFEYLLLSTTNYSSEIYSKIAKDIRYIVIDEVTLFFHRCAIKEIHLENCERRFEWQLFRGMRCPAIPKDLQVQFGDLTHMTIQCMSPSPLSKIPHLLYRIVVRVCWYDKHRGSQQQTLSPTCAKGAGNKEFTALSRP